MLGFAQNLLWRAYQMALCGTAIGINACLEFKYGWIWALPLGFFTAWFGTLAAMKAIDWLRSPKAPWPFFPNATASLPPNPPSGRLDR